MLTPRRQTFFRCLWVCGLVALPMVAYAQQKPLVVDEDLLLYQEKKKSDNKAPAKQTLNLRFVQEKALRAGLQSKQFRVDLELAELSYKTSLHQMFYPSFALTGSANSTYTYGQYPNALSQSVGNTYDSKGFPRTSLSLGLGEFTLYNGGKDTLAYKQALITWMRTKEQLVDKDRDTRFQALVAFAKHQSDREKLDAAERYLNLSISLARLVKTRVQNKKAQKDEYFSALNDVLEARNNLENARLQADQSLWDLNKILGDPIGEDYKLDGKLDFRPLKMGLNEALSQYKLSAPTLLDAKANMERRRLEWEQATRERLPLPMVTVSPLKVSLNQSFDSNYATTSGIVGRSDSHANLDVGFSVNVSVPIWSERGFLGSRTIKGAELRYEREELSSGLELQNSETRLRLLVMQIKKQESFVTNSKQQLKNSVDLLDSVFARVSSGGNAGVSRLELRDSLRSAAQSEGDYREALIEHIRLKFDLARYIGVNLDENADL